VDEKSLFTEFWSKESKTTSKVLSRIPEASDYRPDPKSRTAREIAWQIVGEEKMIIDALETGVVKWTPAPPPATMISTSSANSGRRRRSRGVFFSTSCTTGVRSRRICGRWDQPSRRCTARVRTSRSDAVRHIRKNHYSIVMAPDVSPAAGNVVESIARTTPSAPAVTLNAMFGSAGVPSPKSSEAVPLKVARPSVPTEP
jgi:hypothetical protein